MDFLFWEIPFEHMRYVSGLLETRCLHAGEKLCLRSNFLARNNYAFPVFQAA